MSRMSSSMIDISMRLNSVEAVSFCRLSTNSRVIEKGKIPIAVLFVNTLSAWESIYLVLVYSQLVRTELRKNSRLKDGI
jgi:hypothetical protein